MFGMEKRERKTYSKKRKKNRRFNTILYILAGILMLSGVVIIISDTTYFFDRLLHPEAYNAQETLPPGEIVIVIPTPDADVEDATIEPANTDEIITPEPVVETPVPEPQRPVSVIFMDHNIVCPVDPVGLNQYGQMGTVRAYNRAGWLQTSGTPTTGGNIIIAGHNKYSGRLGYFDVVKSSLEVGDIVVLKLENNENAYYMVESINKWRYDEVPDYVMQVWGEPRLTLITCYGDFNSSVGTSMHRVIAICRPIVFETIPSQVN